MRYTIYLTAVECSTVKYFAFIRAPPGTGDIVEIIGGSVACKTDKRTI